MEIPQYLLDDGSIVIGTQVDENNQLHYIVKKDEETIKIKASGITPVQNLIKHETKLITITTT